MEVVVICIGDARTVSWSAAPGSFASGAWKEEGMLEVTLYRTSDTSETEIVQRKESGKTLSCDGKIMKYKK